MPVLVKQSSTQHSLLFFLTQSSDHITGLTGASPTVTISKAGGAFATPSGAVTELANGWYQVAADATDTNTLGLILLHATAASADPCDMIVADVVAVDPTSSTWGIQFPTNFSLLLISAAGKVTTTAPAPSPFAGYVMNGINAASPFDFWLYNPTTGDYLHVGGLPNEDFKPN